MVFAFAGDSTITRFFATVLGASSPVTTLAGFAPVQITDAFRAYTLPDLCKREMLAGMLGDATFEFKFQQQSKHGLGIQPGRLDDRINVESLRIF